MRITEIYLKDEYFNYNIISKLIEKYVKERYDIMNKFKKLDSLKEYLIENYDVDLKDIIDKFKELITISRYSDKYIIDINKYIYKEGKKIDIINLINYGNREIKGTTLIFNSIKDFRDNVVKIYKLYKKGIVVDGN